MPFHQRLALFNGRNPQGETRFRADQKRQDAFRQVHSIQWYGGIYFFGPSIDAPLNMADISESMSEEKLKSPGASASRFAMNDDFLVWIQFLKTIRELTQGDQSGTRQTAEFMFIGFPNIQQNKWSALLKIGIQIVDGDFRERGHIGFAGIREVGRFQNGGGSATERAVRVTAEFDLSKSETQGIKVNQAT